MLALEVSTKDGKRICIGGVAARELPLSCIVTNVWGREGDGRKKSKEKFSVSIHGFRRTDDRTEQLWWRPRQELEVGEEVTIRIVEVGQVQEPTKVARSVRADEVHPTCSFCGATKDEVRAMAYGRGAAVCFPCAERIAASTRKRIDSESP